MLSPKDIPAQSLVLANKSIYGDPRGLHGHANPAWKAANIVMMKAPWPMHMDAVPIKQFEVHKLAVDNFQAAFDNLLKAANGDLKVLEEWGVTRFSGTYCHRVMRGLTTLSMHSYGCAIDLDAGNNMLGNPKPRFARFPKVLKAFKDAGFVWGGDWNSNGASADQKRHDGMHWQLTQPVK